MLIGVCGVQLEQSEFCQVEVEEFYHLAALGIRHTVVCLVAVCNRVFYREHKIGLGSLRFLDVLHRIRLLAIKPETYIPKHLFKSGIYSGLIVIMSSNK